MPDAGTPTPETQTSGPVFSALVQKFGLRGALALLPLLTGGSTASKAFAGGQLASGGLEAAGALGGSPALSTAGGDLGTALGLASTGYGIAETASNPNLSTTQKAGHSAGQLADLGVATFVPYGAVGVAAKSLADILRQSGSPQLRGAGRAIAAPALPVEGLLSVLQGDASPRAAGNAMVQGLKDTPLIGGIAGDILGAFGLGTKPTTGTDFRTGLQSIFGKLGLGGFNRGDKSLYAGSGNTADRGIADFLGALLGSYSPGFGKDPNAYSTQAGNILAGKFGMPGQLKTIADSIFKQLNLSPQSALQRLQGLKLPPDLLSRLAATSQTL